MGLLKTDLGDPDEELGKGESVLRNDVDLISDAFACLFLIGDLVDGAGCAELHVVGAKVFENFMAFHLEFDVAVLSHFEDAVFELCVEDEESEDCKVVFLHAAEDVKEHVDSLKLAVFICHKRLGQKFED